MAGTKTGLRVLVVDDYRDSTDSLVRLVRQWGHEAFPAYDGMVALELANQHLPHAVLLDLGLPKLTGFAVAEQMRQNSQLATTKLIALTGHVTDYFRHRAREAGFDEFIAKPYAPHDLKLLLEAIPANLDAGLAARKP